MNSFLLVEIIVIAILVYMVVEASRLISCLSDRFSSPLSRECFVLSWWLVISIIAVLTLAASVGANGLIQTIPWLNLKIMLLTNVGIIAGANIVRIVKQQVQKRRKG
jgi:hypothetical protein